MLCNKTEQQQTTVVLAISDIHKFMKLPNPKRG